MEKPLILIPGLISFIPKAIAQRPTHVPGSGEPARFLDSIESIIFYIVIPVVIGILYFIWKKKTRKEQKNNENNN